MATSTIEYLGQLRTKSTHLASGEVILTDAPIDNNGKGEAFSPTDLMSTSLGNCMLTIMGIAANTHGIDMVGTSVLITKKMGQDPRRVIEIVVELEMPKLNYSEKEKKILEHAGLTCPVAKSLHPDLIQNIKFNW